MPRRFAVIGALALIAGLTPVAPAQALSADVVISQVYGGGNSVGAIYMHDFVELFNRGSSAVSLSGMSVQYASATGTGNFGTNPVTLLSGSLAPGQYYLVEQGGGSSGLPLPAPDVSGAAAMSNSSAKVALVDSTTGLACNGGSTPCSPTQLALIKDLVGYGSTTNFYEGAGPTATLSATTAALRLNNGCTETDNNAADFATGAPTPRNTASPLSPCPAPETAPSVESTNPANGATDVPPTANLTVTFSEPVNVADPWFTLSCSSSGSVTASTSGGPTTFTLDPASTLPNGESCTLTVLATQVTDQDTDDPPDTMAADYIVSFTPMDICLTDTQPIGAVQGSGASVAIPGNVAVKGVVTGDFEGTAATGGFYVQEPAGDGDPATSDGIFVYTGNADLVTAGEIVVVKGFARERYGQTSLNGSDSNTAAVSAANIGHCGSATIAATDVSLPFAAMDSPERYEGMLVRFPQELMIAEHFNFDRYGEIVLALPLPGESRPYAGTAVEEPGAAATARTLANSLRRITLDDVNSTQNPAQLRHPAGDVFSLSNRFRSGDTATNTVGVLGYDFSLYRVLPTGPATYTATNPRPATPASVGGTLRIASMNAMNFFVTGDTGAYNCGPAQNLECRGWDADQPSEFTRQRDKLLATLDGLEADVIGLTELENTTGVEPLADLVAGLPGYAYIDTGTIGTDAIKAGLLYRTAAVSPSGVFQILDASDDPRFLDDLNRPVLAQTFQDKATGERFTVAVSHFKSKGSACPGDPDLGDGQGNCNVTRTDAAKALVDWLATDPTGSGDPDVLVIGDLNAYALEDPVDAVKAGPDDTVGTGDDFTDLIGKYVGVGAYSYVFDGQAGYLDHALGSPSLTGRVTGTTVWHVNADEPDVFDYDTSFKPPAQDILYEPNTYRSSDHDPVLVGLDTSAVAPVEPPTQPPTQPPAMTKQQQSGPKAPKRIKKRGVTVLTKKNARTSAGQPVSTKVSGKAKKGKVRLFKVIKGKQGKVSVRTFGRKGWRLVLVRTAPGNDTHTPWRQRTVYVNGKRR